LINHSYYGKFRGVDAYFNVISVYGNIYKKHYSKWSMNYDVEPLDLLDDDIEDFLSEKNHYEQREYKEIGYLEQFLIEYITGTDCLILWLDNDSVGENICFQIKRLIKKHRIDFDQENILRALFSSLGYLDIRTCYDGLSLKPDKEKSMACDVREEIDLRIGQAFTYYLTSQLRKTFKEKLDNKRFSYGPCQFPTFWFCYERFVEIQNFVPEQYWQIKAIIKLENGNKVSII
jgi:DNA topoisomerase-3